MNIRHSIVLFVFGCLVSTSFAQGRVDFKNFGVGFDAPVFNLDGQTRLDSTFSAELLAGPTADSLAPVITVAFLTAGYFFGGEVTIPGVAAGNAAFVQVRAFETGAGSFDNAVLRGAGNIFSVVTSTGSAGNPPTTPSEFSPANDPVFMTGIQSFTIVPEPSIFLLGAAGVGLLFLRRRQ